MTGFRVVLSVFFSLAFQILAADAAQPPLPAWVNKAIAVRKASRSQDVIEEAVYNGKRVFEIIAGDRFDTGDEHAVFAEDGKEICKFGGFVGRVSSGSCTINKIVYVRTLYPEKH